MTAAIFFRQQLPVVTQPMVTSFVVAGRAPADGDVMLAAAAGVARAAPWSAYWRTNAPDVSGRLAATATNVTPNLLLPADVVGAWELREDGFEHRSTRGLRHRQSALSFDFKHRRR